MGVINTRLEIAMKSILLASAILLGINNAVSAASLDELQGAWAEDGFDCDQTFRMSGNTIDYIDRGGSQDTGVIIRGSSIEGPDATCTAKQIKRDGDVMTVLLACSSHIMSGNVATSFRLLGDGHFEHFENAFPEIAVSYKRCHK
ncbi:hypothetical protein LA66_13875 [Aureimonas altamirensis]|uniref:Uncharacterized protein n=1 Tax=Aureimonas altamirensis TaxID=370622 RepID=A0A0B1Q6Q1_9HYPH|nr:hypothetical protein [Aureimonas altamirensis]KHJ54520.1 hypothetical protein LA66_13875 [Aureimonas altamirensis]